MADTALQFTSCTRVYFTLNEFRENHKPSSDNTDRPIFLARKYVRKNAQISVSWDCCRCSSVLFLQIMITYQVFSCRFSTQCPPRGMNFVKLLHLALSSWPRTDQWGAAEKATERSWQQYQSKLAAVSLPTSLPCTHAACPQALKMKFHFPPSQTLPPVILLQIKDRLGSCAAIQWTKPLSCQDFKLRNSWTSTKHAAWDQKRKIHTWTTNARS